jgi:hypothetical protein
MNELARPVTLAVENHRPLPEYYPYFRRRKLHLVDIEQEQRNPLLASTSAPMAQNRPHPGGRLCSLLGDPGRRRVTLIVSGSTAARDRLLEAERLLAWGFREFGHPRLFAPAKLAEAESGMGGQNQVPWSRKRDHLGLPWPLSML